MYIYSIYNLSTLYILYKTYQTKFINLLEFIKAISKVFVRLLLNLCDDEQKYFFIKMAYHFLLYII